MLLCLSQARNSISNVAVFCVFSELRRYVIVRFVDIGGIVNPHCFNFLFITLQVTHISIYTNILYTHTSLKGLQSDTVKPFITNLQEYVLLVR